jgi:hypothetical protein
MLRNYKGKKNDKKSESVSRPNDHQMITGSGATALALSLIL